ncbi:MAG: ATP-binding protein [Oscillospiraceae bacterium]|nr:ATP-binding protein [Oscillospiraceae bacterium]MBQ7130857.1 ATP-binding protein [Oscillospiraceae bacterium]
MSEELNKYRIPEEIRKRVLSSLKEEIARNGSASYAEIGGRILRNLQINWSDYSGSAGKLSEWLKLYFPELEPTPDNRGMKLKPAPGAGVKEPMTQQIRDRVAAAIVETLGENDSALLSDLGWNLVAKGIDRKKYTNEGLSDWVRGMFPDFQKSSDGLRFSWGGNESIPSPAPVPTPVSAYPQPSYPPAELTLSQVDLDENIRQMHTLAYMGWWNNNIRVLKRYTGYTGTDARIWSGIVAQQMTDVLLGRKQVILGTPVEGTSCAAFYSGIDTQDGNPIYCVMTCNKDRKAQPMMLLDFCWPGNEENTELGDWLKDCFANQISRQPARAREEILQLEDCCGQLEQLREQLTTQLEQALNCLQAWEELPMDRISGLEQYNEAWQQVRSLCGVVEAPQTLTTPQELLDWCGQQNQYAAVLRQLTQSFDQLREALAEILSSFGTPQPDLTRDRDALSLACEQFSKHPDTAPLQAILLPYHQLKDVMDGPKPDQNMQELFAVTGQLNQHFNIVSMMLFGGLHRPELQTLVHKYADRLQDLQAQITELEKMNQAPAALTQQKPPLPDPQVLLEAVCSGDVMSLWTACGGENQLETLILEDRLPEALTFACDRQAMLEAGFDEETRQDICARLADGQSLPEGYVMYHIALRINRILGNQNATAERYFLMGMFADRADCSTELLNIYRQTNQLDKFVALWEQFGSASRYDPENYRYYIRYLLENRPEQVQAYLDSHVFLYYLPDFAQLLGNTSCAAAETLPANPLEQALIADDRQTVLMLLSDPAALEEMGYSQEQITQISQAAISESVPEGTLPFQTGMRIYQYQGNLHLLAEQYLWEGLSRSPSTEISNKLVCLLAKEGRWRECIRLYNCFAASSGISNDSRQAYLMAMLQADPVKAQQDIRGNLQGFLTLVQQNAQAAAAVDTYRNSSSEAFRAFYESLYRIIQVLEEDYPRSVLLHDRSLRDLVTQPALIADLNLDDRQLESAKTIYQAGNYPQGPDAESVAKRAYAFLGSYHGIAEQLARFCLPTKGALALLWNIVCDNADIQEQYLLLQSYPALRETYPHAYSHYLFHTGQYDLFLAWLDGYQNDDTEASIELLPEEILQQLIALLQQDPQTEIVVPVLNSPLTSELTDSLTRLTIALVGAGRLDDAASLLLENFEVLLGSCSSERLEQIMTAGGSLSPSTAEAIQARALADGAFKTALYYHNTLGVGDIAEQADAYYQALLDQSAQESLEEQFLRMDELGKLYPGRHQDLQNRMCRMHVYELLKTEPYTKEIQTRLAKVLEECTLDTEDIRSLISDVQASVYAGGDAVVKSIAMLTDRDDLLIDGLVYLHRTAVAASKKSGISDILYRSLCQRYADVLDRDCFPEELGDEAEMLCRRIILANSKRYDVVFCLYRIEMRLGHRSRAECVLRYLSMQPTGDLGVLYALVEAAAEDFWADKVPSMLHTFVEYVQYHTPEEILVYCDFSKTFIHTSDEDWSTVHEYIQNMRQQKSADNTSVREYSPCTQTEGESLVKVLCAAPDKADYWWACTRLPGLSQAARAKLLFICGKKNPNMYKECVKFCAETEQDDMLLQVLREWVDCPSPGPKNCRTSLADMLVQEPGFFARWTREEDTRMLLDILERLCCDIREDLGNLYGSAAHTALNAISAIAVAIGSPEAVEMFERYLSGPLFNRNTEVGVATVLRLLLANRPQQAVNLQDGLFHSTAPVACRLLIEQLHALTPEELTEQVASHEHRLLWGMLLPDGNRPAAQDIYQFVLSILRKNRIQEGANVLNLLLDIFPGDYVCCDALFTMCKFEIENRIPLLHKALCGLVCGSSTGSSYFRRDHRWNAKLLAGLNAIIKARGLEQSVHQFHTGYDFNQEAGHYCLANQPIVTGNDVKNINQVQRSLSSSLQNLHAEALEWRCQGILCWITGSWSQFLHTAWENRADDTDVSRIRDSVQYSNVRSDQDSVGFCRSLLQVTTRLEPAQRIPFLQWVWLALTGDSQIPRGGDFKLSGKLRQTALAFDLVSADVPEKIGDLSLDLPLDENSLMSLIFAESVTPCIGKDTELLYNRLWLLGAVVDYPPMIIFQYFNPAQAAFRVGDDKTAAAHFEAMLRLLDRGLSRGARQETQEYNKKSFSFNKELYEAYSRICRLKAGDSKIIAKVGSPKFHIWSCINMTVALICSPRGNEALQMAEAFSEANRTLCRNILRVIDPEYPDLKKLDLLQRYPNCLEKAFLAYIMRSGTSNGTAFSPLFFKDSSMSMKAKNIFMNLAKQYDKFFDVNNARPWHFMLTNFSQINPVSYKQLPITRPAAVQISEETTPIPDSPGQQLLVPEAVLPSFAQALTPLEQPDRLEQLQEEYDQLPHFQRYYQDRLERSEQIYRIQLAVNNQPVAMLPSLIRLGLDHYDNLDLNNPEECSRAYRSIMELVVYADSLRTAAEGVDLVNLVAYLKPLETAVENSIIYTLLDKGHLSIQSLVTQFAQDRKAFGIMQNMVQQDEFRKEALTTIYAALDLLIESYSVNSGNSIVLRNALNRAKGLIGNINYGAWQSLKNNLQGLIQNEINCIDRRPILDLEIQNRGVNPEEDYLYGEIRNEGMESASDITLQVAYEDSSSDRLRLAQLAPNEHVAFKIRYSAPEGAMSLRYTINWSYVFNGQTYIQPIKEDTLDIAQLPDPKFPVNQYETQTISDFYEDENGVLGNPDFFGRERETEDLRNLFRSGRFPSYNNAIVYGIRRAGKTTLLNYVQAYVTLHCSDAIIVKVDCLINPGTQLVQTLFIDHVLAAIQSRYPQYAQTEEWQHLEKKWRLSPEAADRDPSNLELFYQELKLVTGKGLILMLDEVDNFFTSVEQQTSLDSYLFQVLSNMLCSASCQQAVHFIFCGSKYLLRYRNGDGGLSQLFQRFGSNIIEVGLIPNSEMQQMIRKPYEAYPEVDITDEAINWIWEYTQGLVWHVKLLANMVLDHVRECRRSVVYPVDVKDKIHSLVEKAYCEQFFDGINSKEQDKRERLVVDAMQSMASLRTSYVPRGVLQQILTSERLPTEYRMTIDQLENALDNLIKLKLVTYSESNQGYRFSVDLYRLYFRNQRDYPFVFKKQEAPDQTFVCI